MAGAGVHDLQGVMQACRGNVTPLELDMSYTAWVLQEAGPWALHALRAVDTFRSALALCEAEGELPTASRMDVIFPDITRSQLEELQEARQALQRGLERNLIQRQRSARGEVLALVYTTDPPTRLPRSYPLGLGEAQAMEFLSHHQDLRRLLLQR
jgi:hypothetical protein